MNNARCDGSHCESEDGVVRVLPLPGDGNLNVCQPCYKVEITWRIGRNEDLAKENQFDTPPWEALPICEDPEPDHVCRECGCTDSDCRGCIEKTGRPCHWVEDDLCSACADKERKDATARE